MSTSAVADFIIVQAEGKSWFGKPQPDWAAEGTRVPTAAVYSELGDPSTWGADDAEYEKATTTRRLPSVLPMAQCRALEVSTAGLTVEPRRPRVLLSPVYEYTLLLVPGPQGQPQMQPSLRPPFGLLSVTSLALPGAAVWVAVADLADDEQRMFARLLKDTESAIDLARAQAAGLSTVARPQIPTSFGGGPRQ